MKPPIFTIIFFIFFSNILQAQSPCDTPLPEFQLIGVYNGHNYYLSEYSMTPENAQTNTNLYTGYLAVIDDEAENEFIQQSISEMVYIGLSDVGTEGVLEWQNGAGVNYTNFDICSFCNGNSDELDYVMMHPWNGGWSWSSKWNPRKYILEIPCGESADLSLEMTTSNISVAEGEEFVITLLLKNDGPNEATNISTQYINVTHLMSTLLSESVSQGTIIDIYNNVKDWNITSLQVGATAQMQLTYRAEVGAPGYFYGMAEVKQVDQDDPDSTPGNNQSSTEDDEASVSVTYTDAGYNCPGDFLGFTTIGEFGNSKYYVSNENAENALTAQAASENLGGNLASINSQVENDFVLQGISEMTYIGLHDRQTEGMLEWYDGSSVDYTNFDFCSFCNENSSSYNNVVMHHWNGGWSWSNTSNSRKFVVEIPCGYSTGVDLALNSSASVTEVAVGDPFDVVLIVTNNGPQVATDILITVWRSEYAEIVLGTPSVGTFEYDYYLSYKWEIPVLASGETAELILNCEATASPTNSYSLGGYVSELDQVDPNSANDNTSVGVDKIMMGGCPDAISGFSLLGEFNNSKYFLSDDIARPVDAQAVAESHGGWLATSTNQAENDFLQQNINELAYIGLTDFSTEGSYEWLSGEPVDYTNFDNCSICFENGENMDFVMIHPWNGGWSWSNFWNNRKYIIEIPCNNTVSSNLGNSMIANTTSNVIESVKLKQVFPNPAESIIHVAVRSDLEKTIYLQVLDAQGMLVQTMQAEMFEGENTFDMDISNLPAGMYFLRIPELDGKEKGMRFVKVRD